MEPVQHWKTELNLLAEILSKTPLVKTVKWGADVYTYNGKNVVSYLGFKNHFTLWFYNGVFLDDTDQVLLNASEGKTKSQRQWRFTNIDQIDEKKILQYVLEAIEVEKKGLRIPPEKFKPVPLPSLFEEALKSNAELKENFERLTPGKQKEYVLYILEAKQDATKQKRIEKAIPLILQGCGLNDRYK